MPFNSQPATRRQFLSTAGGAAMAGIAAARGLPAFATESDTPAPQPPIRLGSGEHTYDCIHDWLVPPPNIRWGDTHGVAQDAEGRIYIAHTVHPDSPTGDAILVFNPDGTFLTSWGARFRGGAHGLDIRHEGNAEYLSAISRIGWS